MTDRPDLGRLVLAVSNAAGTPRHAATLTYAEASRLASAITAAGTA